MFDKKNTFDFLNGFYKSPGITKECKSLLKLVLKKSKRMSDESLMQFFEIISFYYNDFFNELDESFQNMVDENDWPPEVRQTVEELINVYGADPGSICVREIPDKKYSNVKNNPNDITNSNAQWIKRRPLLMDVSDHDIVINDSFMDYLEEIQAASQPRMSTMDIPYERTSPTNSDIGVLMGTSDKDITITMVGGVSEYETFYFSRNDKDLGVLDQYDFNYFNSQTKGKFIGKYLFEIDRKQHLFIGKKIV